MSFSANPASFTVNDMITNQLRELNGYTDLTKVKKLVNLNKLTAKKRESHFKKLMYTNPTLQPIHHISSVFFPPM